MKTFLSSAGPACALLASLCLAGCQSPSSTSNTASTSTAAPGATAGTTESATKVDSAKPGDKITIGFLVKQPEEPWFQSEWKFADKAAAKLGDELIKLGTPDGEKALKAIDNLAAKGAQGVIICPPDVKLGPAIVAKAKAQKIKVLTVDDRFVGADGNPMDVPYMGISAREIGHQVGQALADEMKKRGWKPEETAACAITHDEVETCRERTGGATDALTSAGFVRASIYSAAMRTTDIEGAFNAANTVLTQHPEAKHWLAFSSNDEGVLGAVRAMEGRGMGADNAIGVGIGGITAVAEFKKPKPTGFMGSILLNPSRHGAETVEMMHKWIKDGVEPPKVTLTTGRLVTRDTFEAIMKEQGMTD